MATLDSQTLPYEAKNLFTPSLEEIKKHLATGLKNNFQEVCVEVVECPDLTKAPFHLAAKGLNGNPTLLEVGGPPYLLPLVDRSKLYDMKTMCETAVSHHTMDGMFVIGAGAGPFPLLGTNVEGMFNFHVHSNGTITNETHVAQVDTNLQCALHKVPQNETRCALLGNVLISEGKPGKVLHVNCKIRTGNDDFIAAMRKVLTEKYTHTVGLGGTFLLKHGKAKQHVMQDFSKTPINTEEELNTWLKFYEQSAELINVGIFLTDEADLDLRLQHFHSFSKSGYGGHYHIDTTPDVVEYDGYFVLGERIVRVDKPLVTHKFGRD